MNYDHYTDCAVAMAEDLVNTAPGPRELEELGDLAALAEFLRRHRLSAPGRLTGGVLAEIRA
ncbi:MAG: ABATE domain-containing protein, partial [Euzebyales bacterium]|nr:ABATE domain-containing protein [Euzebyales bacterium]